MKRLLLPLALAIGLGAAQGAFADEAPAPATPAAAPAAPAAPASPFAFNIGVTSDYLFRGITQNGNGIALQGGVDYTQGIFYAGLWSSNVNFAPRELDGYFGIRPTLGKTAFDIGVIRYDYDKAASNNVTEAKIAVSHPIDKSTVGLAFYQNTVFHNTYYYEINDSTPINDTLTLSGAIGSQHFQGTGGSYGTANIGLTYAVNPQLSIDGRISGTDLSHSAAGRTRFILTLKGTF
jgi:uncharacterized protein (TIGR02001 family)